MLTHSENLGKGHALKTGLDYIWKNYPANSVVVTLDADGQHTVPDAIRCIERAQAEPGSLVLGCRVFHGDIPLRSRFGNKLTRMVYRLSSGVSVSDTQTGLRAFSAEMIPFLLTISGERYEYEMNVLLECPKVNLPIREVPIATIYENHNSGSHFHAFRDSFRIYRDILKFAGSSFISFLVDYSLYSLLVIVTASWGTSSIPFSNITARIISASINFTINRNLVFHSQKSVLHTGTQYFLLASCILCGNTILLSWLVNTVGLNRFGAKLITELIFFTLSWIIQKTIIFRKRVSRS